METLYNILEKGNVYLWQKANSIEAFFNEDESLFVLIRQAIFHVCVGHEAILFGRSQQTIA
jgi:hypothetical protein